MDGGSECESQAMLLANLHMNRRRIERRIVRLEDALASAGRCAARMRAQAAWADSARNVPSDEKTVILDEIERQRAELQQVCSRVMPETVSDILSEYCTVWFVDYSDDGFEALAESLALVASSSSRLHCAQAVNGGWRVLEDPQGRSLSARPACMARCTPMSFRALADELGLFVQSLHRVVSPRYALNFCDCSDWEQVQAALAASAHTLNQLREEGWEVDTSAYCSDESSLLLVKHLPQLRSLQDEAAEGVRGAGRPQREAQHELQQRERALPARAGSQRSSGSGAVQPLRRTPRLRRNKHGPQAQAD